MTTSGEDNVHFDITAPVDAKVRAKDLIRDFLVLGCHEQMTIHSGFIEGRPAIVVEFLDRKHVLYSTEAKLVADALQQTMHQFPNFHQNGAVANLIMGMRLGADEAEAWECQAASTS